MDSATPLTQTSKLAEELSELILALAINDSEEVEDAIGDMGVVLTILARLANVGSLQSCMETAYAEIRDRKGTMINGTFVKEQTAK